MPRILSIVILVLLAASPSRESAQEAPQYPSLIGSWEGPLVQGRDNMNLAFTFSFSEGKYTAVLVSSGLGVYGMPADTVRINKLKVFIQIPKLDLEFTGTLRLDAAKETILRIDGDWFQHSEMVPLVLMPVATPSF